MEMWTEVRRRVLTGELSKLAACREYGINWQTLVRMLAHVEPPGYRRQAQRDQPVLGSHPAIWSQRPAPEQFRDRGDSRA